MEYDKNTYTVEGADSVISPELLYYRDIITANTKQAIDMAGGANRLIPHVKSHKMSTVVRLQMGMGITKFKCATIAEAEMTASQGASVIVLSYPLAGPNIKRFTALQKSFPGCRFYAIGDDPGQLEILAEESRSNGLETDILIDVDMGMNRTGAALEKLESLYRHVAALEGLKPRGMHCYDGHNTNPDPAVRENLTRPAIETLCSIRRRLISGGLDCGVMILGGTPSFQVHRSLEDVWLSPGTLFINDHGYRKKYPDLGFQPGAAILTRVVSHPGDGLFTLDCGSKAIATDSEERGVIVGFPYAEPLFQSEEHWVFKMKADAATPRPLIGSILYIIPTHICPTSALYPWASVISGGKIVERWEVTARNRKLTI